jgi:hypothetical protein
VTLEDVALLFKLPCLGEPMGAFAPPPPPPANRWRDDILARFAGVVRRPDAPKVPDFTNSHGPTRRLVAQAQRTYLDLSFFQPLAEI